MNDETTTEESVTPKQYYQCPECDHPPYDTVSGIRYHMRVKHGVQSYGVRGDVKCPDCDYTSSSAGVNLHRSLKHGLKGKWAMIRDARKKRQLNKLYHYKNKGGPLGCSYCDFSTKSKSGLARHINQQHGNETGYAMIGKPTRTMTVPSVRIPVERDHDTMRDKVLELVAEKIYNKLMEGLSRQ